MSVREQSEDDRQNKNCPSRGLGLAAAAIGVGVGAALYYFFSKRPENPHEEGSTSTWECEQTQAFIDDEYEESRQEFLSNDSYTTLSEHSTTDTSIHTTPIQECFDDTQYISDDNNDAQSDGSLMSIDTDCESDSNANETISSETDLDSDSEIQSVSSESDINDSNVDDETGYLTLPMSTTIHGSDSENDWDVTDSSVDVPEESRVDRSPLLRFIDHFAFVSPRNIRNGSTRIMDQEQMARAQAFRERSWSLEECSICFEVILKSQDVMSLPCTHHFHTACILPWLQEQQTCPNCRKAAE